MSSWSDQEQFYICTFSTLKKLYLTNLECAYYQAFIVLIAPPTPMHFYSDQVVCCTALQFLDHVQR